MHPNNPGEGIGKGMIGKIGPVLKIVKVGGVFISFIFLCYFLISLKFSSIIYSGSSQLKLETFRKVEEENLYYP